MYEQADIPDNGIEINERSGTGADVKMKIVAGGRKMKAIYMIGLALLVIGAGILAGCVDEVVDPELNFRVMDVHTNLTSPNPNGVNASEGHHFVYVQVELENKNKDLDLTIAPGSFYADDNVTEVIGSYLANGTTLRRIDTIRVDANTKKVFWVTFEIPDGIKLTYIRYRGTLDEPVQKDLPDY
ncbi:MAG: hypothetical protein JXA22_01525 [Candidatus Thermoplasmatota archaeon]|nr:hypothetical protein [Candidatus Thermoplasmatota archaeon]